MHILPVPFFDGRSFTCAFLSNLWLLASGVAVLGACQHTTIAENTAGSSMAAVEASQTQSMINLKDVLMQAQQIF